jgi:hypothetical protein
MRGIEIDLNAVRLIAIRQRKFGSVLRRRCFFTVTLLAFGIVSAVRLGIFAAEAPKEIFGRVIAAVAVELDNGQKWEVQKADCFPIIKSVQEHKRVVLKLASTSFALPADQIEILTASEERKAVLRYRQIVGRYLEQATNHWRTIHEKVPESKGEAEPVRPAKP